MALDKNGKELPKGITLRADGRYMGRFKHNGESHTVYDKDLKAVKKKLADLKYEVQHGIYAKEADITVEAWFSTWMKEYKENSVKYGTLLRYHNVFRNRIQPILGKKKLKDLRAEHIQKLYNSLTTDDFSKTTINIVNVVLNSMYEQAFKNGIIQKNPVKMTTMPRQRKKEERRVLSTEEQKLFMEYATNSKYYPLYQVALFTGMRNGELRALQWSNINFKNEVITVDGTLQKIAFEGYMKEAPKTAKSRRDIPMLEGVMQILKKHRLEQKKLRLFIGEAWKPDDTLNDLVFTTDSGRPMSSVVLSRDIERIIKNINTDEKKQALAQNREPVRFEHFSSHAFRHTFATRGIENGIPPKVMQEILGHTTLAMTMDLYAHVLPDTKANEMKKIAHLF